MTLSGRKLLFGLGVALVVLAPVIAEALGLSYYIGFLTRVAAFAIAAVSLDLILGYGGMVSFGHAAYLGVGAYAFAILALNGISNVLAHLLAAMLASGAAGLLIGAVCLRTSGFYFIMITLAFSQMLYYLGVSLKQYGGDDGMSLPERSDFFGWVDLGSDSALYYLAVGLLFLFLWIGRRLTASRFGIVIRGTRSNERRMIALGFPTFRYKLLAFVISGAMCGASGMLLANQALYVSPSLMHWIRSGELMVMVILGGMGTLYGAALGSLAILSLEQLLAGITEHWGIILGLIFVSMVLFTKRGVLGLFLGRPAPSSTAQRHD